jgi:hypothetical protein
MVSPRPPGYLGALARDPRWSQLEDRAERRPWSDAFSDIIGALRWRL